VKRPPGLGARARDAISERTMCPVGTADAMIVVGSDAAAPAGDRAGSEPSS